MPWYSPWSDHIAKSVCKYLLQRYLGQFLEEKLTLDQLTVDLHKGIGVISDVTLDVQALNEVAEHQNIPFEFTDGFIEKMSVSIPWSSILTDATNIQVEGLSLTIKKTERDKTGISMIESMWSSMTSSMQLAEDCLKKERDNSKEDGGHTFEGIESLAHTIDSILSRIKIKFLNTIIRIEEIVESNAFGIGFEINIKLFEYFDEVVGEEKDEAKLDFQLSAFSTKKIYLEGVNLFSDEFSLSSADESLSAPFNEDSQKNEENFPDASLTENILVGHFAGRQELTLKFKQDGIEGPKVDIQISLGAFTVFLSPHQAHNLLYLVSGMTSSANNSRKKAKSQCLQKAMGESDFRKIERELQMNLKDINSFQPKGLSNQGWASTCLDGSEDEFTPMNTSSRLNDSVISLNSSFSSSIMSTSSRSSNRILQTSVSQQQRKSHSGNTDIDPNNIVFHFHILLSSLSIILLHEDVLTVSADSNQSTVSKFSFEEMRNLASEFFEKLERFVAMGYGNKDFENARELFQSICQLNHIRITAASIIVEGNEISTSNVSVIKGKCTVSNMEIVESLFEKEIYSEKQIVEYVELLKFKKSFKDKKDLSHVSLVQPNVLINFKFSQMNSLIEKGKRSVQPKTNLSFELQPFEVEIDITMVDRVNALLSSKSFFKAKSLLTINSSNLKNPTNKEYFEQVVYGSETPNCKQDIKLSSSFVTLKIRFPIPDLRPIHDMDKPPWWKRSIRKDILFLDVTDLSSQTILDNAVTILKYDFQFRDVVVKFKEGDLDNIVELARATTLSNCENVKKDIGWPRISIYIYPKMNSTDLDENEINLNYFKTSHNGGCQSLLNTLENTVKKEYSPFSRQKIVHESDTPHSKTLNAEQRGEEIIIPGDNTEIADFIDVASVNTRIRLDVALPFVSVILPSKHLFEVLYNRISSDLLLWEPSAPINYNFSKNSNLNVTQTMDDFISTFSLCKSAMQDSDSDTESQDGIFYSVYEQKQKYKKKQLVENNILIGQSKIVLHINVTQGYFDLYAPVRDSQENVIPRQYGQLHFSVDEGNLFLVSGYKGKSDLDYICVQVNRFSFYHNGLLSESEEQPVLRTINVLPKNLQLTVKKTEKCALIDQSTNVGTGSSSLDMLTLSISLQKHNLTQGLKVFRVAIGIREATLFHKVCNDPNNWFSQLVDFFDVTDYPIAGYDPSSVLSEINVHLWNCSVDYRPLYLPLRSILTLGNFNVSSNIAAQTSSSTLRFIAEDVSFFISNKTDSLITKCSADLRKDYVCVMELGLFELSLRLSEKAQVNPKVDLRASGNVAHLWTCSDSAKALMELLLYFASDGDLMTTESNQDKKEHPYSSLNIDSGDQLLVKTEESENTHGLSKSQIALVNDLMEEAMKESKVVEKNDKKIKEDSSENLSCYKNDDKKICTEKTKLSSSELQCKLNGVDSDEKDDNWEDFYIVENEAGMGILPKKGLPEVRYLTNFPVRLVDNHFSIPLGKADLLQSPKHYPKPVLRYMLRELSLVWHMFGGSDFERNPNESTKKNVNQNSGCENGKPHRPETIVSFSKNSSSGLTFKTKQDNKINWKQRGGAHRRYDILMELQLNKVRFQHEVYPENTVKASRQVLLIQDVELRDRLASSTINKFLYQYSSEAKPKQSQTPMVFVKSVLVRSDPKMNAQECSLKVSLLPLRLNIDQDSILFLYQFFSEISNGYKDDEDDSNSRTQTPKHQVPVMSVNLQNSDKTFQPEPLPLLIDLEEQSLKENKFTKTKRKDFARIHKPYTQPIFIRCFIFSPEVLVKLDYQGKRVDMTHGSLAGILMGLGQLNNSELKLRKISHRHGLLGFDKLMNFVLSEWANDIKKNQLPGLLGGVGPMHSLVQLIQGVRDLFWLPIEQYQKDGRLVRGFQRGANSFTTSTAMASLELISRLIQIIQSTAETAYDIVSPGPSVRSCRQKKGKGKSKRYSQPADIREGVAIAYLVVKEGIGETAETIVRVASEEHEQKGVTGAVGGVLRQIPPTVVKPIILATEATNNVIGGMRSQLIPDVRKEAFEKWKRQDM